MGRRTIARVLVVLASVLAFGGILAVWANRQVLNTDNWTQTSTELLQRPVIRQQLATFLVDQLYANVDAQGEIGSPPPPPPRPPPRPPARVGGPSPPRPGAACATSPTAPRSGRSRTLACRGSGPTRTARPSSTC